MPAIVRCQVILRAGPDSRSLQPGTEDNVVALNGGATWRARASGTSPPILPRVDLARAEICHADRAAAEIIQMNIDLRRGADGDINQLTVDHVSCDPVSVQRLAARSA